MTCYLFKSVQFYLDDGNLISGFVIEVLLSLAIARETPTYDFEINKPRSKYILRSETKKGVNWLFGHSTKLFTKCSGTLTLHENLNTDRFLNRILGIINLLLCC